MIDYINILGVRVNSLNQQLVSKYISQIINKNNKQYINVTGVHGIIESLRSSYIRKIHNRSFLTIPDGMPLVWLGRLKGYKGIKRCYGPDVMLYVMEESGKEGITHYFYGGAEGVAGELKEVMEKRFPGVKIVGTFTPPFRPLSEKEEKDFILDVKRKKPDIIWVGLSTPKQEVFMYEYLPRLDTKIMIGVGAAFDFHTGRVRQAPRWIQRIGMEWFFRILMEPRRLWKRYAKNNPIFLWNIFLQLTGLKKFPIETGES